MTALFAGVMSGTSLDAADAAIVEFSADSPRTLAFATIAMPAGLRATLQSLSLPGAHSLDDAGAASLELANLYAAAVKEALRMAALDHRQVGAIGCHGQTVRHRPERAFTIQLNDPARLAELTGIDVVADFRRRDMAAGGQGAPLAPAFHDAVFRHSTRSRAIVNIGGISNVSCLPAAAPARGFDCGPGNLLLDAWARRHLGTDFDRDGAWAASGRSDPALLEAMLNEAYFSAPPPKSTGRELFHMDWLEARLPSNLRPQDVQATLLELTARSIADALQRYCGDATEVYLCGGGARNRALVARIANLAGERPIAPTDTLGIAAEQVEAAAFAWLAMKCVRREAVDLGYVTGARGPRILGAIYPA